MASERFEMRIDSELLERLDGWRASEDDVPSRAEAIRRLIEGGLAHDNKGKVPVFSDGEKLIAMMLSELTKGMNVRTEIDIDLVQSAIMGGHYWALGWEMPGVFHGHADKQSRVRFVTDVLDMWSFLEEAHESLDENGKQQLADQAAPFGKNVEFPGFDGNHESEHLSIARFMIEKLGRFERFKDRVRGLNSHHETLGSYSRMFNTFEPIRKNLIGRRMTADELAAVLNSRRK